MTIPIASGGHVGVIPTTIPTSGLTGSSLSRGTENRSAIQTVQSTDKSGAGASAGRTGNNETTAGLYERSATGAKAQTNRDEDYARPAVIAPDVSIGPSPAFITSVLEAANAEALNADTKATTETEDEAPLPVVETETTQPQASAVQEEPTTETQLLDQPARAGIEPTRSVEEPGQKPSVETAS